MYQLGEAIFSFFKRFPVIYTFMNDHSLAIGIILIFLCFTFAVIYGRHLDRF